MGKEDSPNSGRVRHTTSQSSDIVQGALTRSLPSLQLMNDRTFPSCPTMSASWDEFDLETKPAYDPSTNGRLPKQYEELLL